jgi:RNA polymerase sigma-70 factor, ECF subfamily
VNETYLLSVLVVMSAHTVQETFIRAWRHLPQLSADDRPIRPWPFRVARNLLIDASRAARSQPRTVQVQRAEDAPTDPELDQILESRADG